MGHRQRSPDLVPRFKRWVAHRTTTFRQVDLIRKVLSDSRQHIQECFAKLSDNDLETIPVWYKERGWNIRRILQILIWHEAHHQGQAHITLNLWKASQPKG